MTILLSIGGVDCETAFNIETESIESAVEFLKSYDHEGSSISMRILFENPDEIYNTLDTLEKI
jgi:hypothetical protein